MRRLSLLVICSVAFQLFAAAPAHAWWGWLDELSGPGPWTFFDAQYRIVCIEDPAAHRNGVDVKANDKNPPAHVLRALDSFDGAGKFFAALGGSGCLTDFSKHPKASINVATGWFRTVANDLKGPGNPDTLYMQKYEANVSAFLDQWKIVELIAGGGALKGLGRSEFTRGYGTVSASISPYVMLPRNDDRAHRLLRTFTIDIGVVVVPNGFTAADFASSGTFRSNKEILKTVSVTMDFSKF
jgi:hypothetical protein